MITVSFFYKDDSPECEQVRELLASLQESHPHQLVKIDVGNDPALRPAYENRVPVLQIGPYLLEGSVTRERLVVALGAAEDRARQLEKIDQKSYQDKLARGHTYTSSDRLSLWISNNFMHVINLMLFIYIGLPFLAPVLMKNGADVAAELIYKIYSPVCHQLAYRSWFLYGEQAFYPRSLAAVPGVLSYEEVTGLTGQDVVASRDFLGNPTVGYKVAICQRDVAIYLSLLGFGLVFQLSGRRFRSLPWYLWIAIGIIPIGIDGFSQLPSVIAGLPAWLPLRESNPFLRTVTGSLFGIMTAWYLMPLMEESMRETKRMMMRKQAISSQASLER
jgi:uncharacterized membrane protein